MSIKRKFGEITCNDLEDEKDVSWGGKRTRYIYNYTFESSDSDATESVHSDQSKTTMEAASEADLSSDRSFGSNCDSNGQTNHTEFDVVSTSSSCHDIQSSSSDSSTLIDFKVTNNIIKYDDTSSLDNGYIPDETDVILTTTKTDLPPPAHFIICLQCRKKNPNPHFQYCYVCFRYRMEYFGSLTNSNRKNVKHLNLSMPKKEFNILEDSQKASKQGVTTQITIKEDTITKMNEDIKHIYNSISLIKEYNTNMCNICLNMPKNGVFNHQKISHVYSCYGCAKKIWRNSNRCPVCNVKIKSVTKI
ncbi:E3 ubiquitin-protein ligase Mdm2-like, partial [Metopolophium dirhodum]|uniref:E3 ubiquitin-protein ligase Mdm2-like n=1 Tax=Metopolophium dirhodum TaxID=44670 RepID=UPI0029906525